MSGQRSQMMSLPYAAPNNKLRCNGCTARSVIQGNTRTNRGQFGFAHLELRVTLAFQIDLGEAITARTEALTTFRELGPPDLCHVVKSTGRSGQRDFGSYHYISGVDASSSASLAAYINSLTYAVEDISAWFSKTASGKCGADVSGAYPRRVHLCRKFNHFYSCFNAFSRVDMRVDVKIPGGVNAYVMDLRGERHEATAEIWQETYVSALLRSILYSDDPTYALEAYRKLSRPHHERREQAQVPAGCRTLVQRGMVTGIMKYFEDSGRCQQAANLFEKLMVKEPEVASLLARSYIGMNEEVKGTNHCRGHERHASALHSPPRPMRFPAVQGQV
ncbi:Chs5p-Arf1p-binding proteins-domain-containing protein [Coprinopsis sp. MPI-PUGE-AT-0042]|nr:Chs5p-Arf1p-binding proteins-domain-containing protein [Coprinopsis sp. MPI-PUGE-AT-0042]